MPLISPFFINSLRSRRFGRWRRRSRRNRMTLMTSLLLLIAIIVLPLYFLYKPPGFVVNWIQGRFPSVLFHLPTTHKIVALTIDDAPSEYTREILEILRENEVSATFFTIGGQVAGREKMLEDILRSGSELGNHAMHDEPSINLSSDTLREELKQVDALIEHSYYAVDQKRTHRYFRPGSGIFSTRLLDIAEELGYRTILGSIYPHDPFVPYWRVNSWHILSSLRPGAVIICHDRRKWTVPMLREVVPEIKRRGYEIVTVTGLLERKA